MAAKLLLPKYQWGSGHTWQPWTCVVAPGHCKKQLGEEEEEGVVEVRGCLCTALELGHSWFVVTVPCAEPLVLLQIPGNDHSPSVDEVWSGKRRGVGRCFSAVVLISDSFGNTRNVFPQVLAVIAE